ncbi:MAG: hypothetical protein OEU89_01595 [Burkholderiaceae bacterium]|nr:hypothetical protein [Burkholderiaceae bacterium]MDH5209092.1 hypothetical protein [Burkholderiaceae bacterium]
MADGTVAEANREEQMIAQSALCSTRPVANAFAPVFPATALHRFTRRLRALGRLVVRRNRSLRRLEDLRRLDAATLRDLGLAASEVASVVAELDGRAAATRRRTDLDVWLSASERFRVRSVDSSL